MNRAQPSNSHRVAFLPLALVAMIVTACGVHPPNIPYEVVERVVVVDAVPYVVASQQCLEGYTPWEPCPPEEQVVYTSTDDGLTWLQATTAPPEVAAGRADWTPHRRVACLAETPAVCYRIDGGETIERSADGGETWHAVWEMPTGRRTYQAREMTRLAPDTEPYDIALLETHDEETVIAAMGNQGVLIGTADGSWRRAPVGLAVPVRYQATSLAMAFDSLTLELPVAILASALLLPALCLVGWGVIFLRQAGPEDPP